MIVDIQFPIADLRPFIAVDTQRLAQPPWPLVDHGEFVRYPLAVLGNRDSVAAHLTRELNRPFDRDDEPPFRPFMLTAADGMYLGVVYQHWIADSVSIRAVLREWFVRLFDPVAARDMNCDR